MRDGSAEGTERYAEAVANRSDIIHLRLAELFDDAAGLEGINDGPSSSPIRILASNEPSTSWESGMVVSHTPRPSCFTITLRFRWRSIHSSSVGNRINDDRTVVDLDYLADALPRDGNATTAKTVSSLPVPPDATWAELRLVVREHTIVARLRNQERAFSFEDLGLSGIDDRLWQLLCTLARVGGQTPARSQTVSEKGAATFRKQVSDLRQRLSTVFPINGEPIRAVHGTGGYRCLFQISLDRADGFPVQPERWDDCRFTELPDGRIAISVRTKEVFAARSISEETAHRTDLEAAERSGMRTEEYDLRTLGLADQVGRPTVEGRVLLELLRNGGKLTRRGDDKDVLRLAKRLREWMGLVDSPFQFTNSRMLWNTVFESCTTQVT